MPDDDQSVKQADRPILLGDGTYNEHTELRLLVEEYARLNQEVERLREVQKTLKQEKEKSQKEKGDKSEDDKEGKDNDKDKDDKDKKEDEEEDEKDKPKEPLRTRITNWTKAHPVALLLIAIGLVLLVIAGISLWRYLDSFESTDDAEVDGHINQISGRISGTVVGVYIEDAQNVVKGQVLVDLESRAGPGQYRYAKSQCADHPTTQATQVASSEESVVSADAAVASSDEPTNPP